MNATTMFLFVHACLNAILNSTAITIAHSQPQINVMNDHVSNSASIAKATKAVNAIVAYVPRSILGPSFFLSVITSQLLAERT